MTISQNIHQSRPNAIFFCASNFLNFTKSNYFVDRLLAEQPVKVLNQFRLQCIIRGTTLNNSKEPGRSSPANTELSVGQAMKTEFLTAMMDLQQQIRLRAYEIYCGRDSASATAIDDWLKAEQEIKARAVVKRNDY